MAKIEPGMEAMLDMYFMKQILFWNSWTKSSCAQNRQMLSKARTSRKFSA